LRLREISRHWRKCTIEKYKDGNSTRTDTADINEEDDTASSLSIPDQNVSQLENNTIDSEKSLIEPTPTTPSNPELEKQKAKLASLILWKIRNENASLLRCLPDSLAFSPLKPIGVIKSSDLVA
jgi:hypothetical protein